METDDDDAMQGEQQAATQQIQADFPVFDSFQVLSERATTIVVGTLDEERA